MWYELRTLALANHNNYVIHVQTLCHSVIRDHISLAGFFFRGVIIFSYAEGKPLQFIQDLGSWRRRCGGWRWHMRKACCLCGGSGPGGKGAACGVAKVRVTRDCLHFSLLGSHSQQHLLCPHQHSLTLGWQFHSCGIAIGADGFVSASTQFLLRNWLSKRSLLWPPTLSWPITCSLSLAGVFDYSF